MEITFLGTGTSQGIPVIACDCEVCTSDNSKDNRLRTSIFIKKNNVSFVIDSGPDFRYQMLREKVKHIDGIVYTHEHKDHVAGLDDIRAFNFKQNSHINLYAEDRVLDAIRKEFSYIFSGIQYPGIPQVECISIDNTKFELEGISILPIRAFHHKLPIFGFRIDDFVYLTDLKTVPEEELDKLQNLDVLVISALRREKHVSHLTLQDALDFIDIIKPKKAYLTHLSHQMGLHNEVSKELPNNVFIAYDGLKLIL